MNGLRDLVEELSRHASADLNESLGLSPGYDQTQGNRCDVLTYDVMKALQGRGMPVRRELHMDKAQQYWHYVLAHQPPNIEPAEDDLLSSLNPWQWRDYGGGILHMPRDQLMDVLREEGAPEFFVALHSVQTITRAHDDRQNPFSREI